MPALKQAILRCGVPKRLSVDNGAAYRSHQLPLVMAKLSITLLAWHDGEGPTTLDLAALRELLHLDRDARVVEHPLVHRARHRVHVRLLLGKLPREDGGAGL